MKRLLLLIFALLLSASLFGCAGSGNGLQQETPQQTGENDEKVIAKLVEDFGEKL